MTSMIEIVFQTKTMCWKKSACLFSSKRLMNILCGLHRLSDFLFFFFFLLLLFSVPPFSQEGCQQTADYAAEEKTLQESNHPGLQNFGCGSYKHGWGITFNHQPFNFSWETYHFPLSSSLRPASLWQWLTWLLVSLSCLGCQREGPRVLHIMSDDSCSSHILLCEIMGRLELASYALCRKQRVQPCYAEIMD